MRRVIAEAFGREEEAKLVDDLRADGDLAVSLVAEAYGEVVGHIALSRLKLPVEALALAPVSVKTGEQDKGVGSALVRAALFKARELGYKIVFVLGDPAYYATFGFSTEEAAPFASRYAGPYFMARLLTEEKPAPGETIYPDAFSRLS